ncbi:MAG: PEP-CTERM sorting domain-containing protein [Telluria sp.]|jgi:hypothetical protein
MFIKRMVLTFVTSAMLAITGAATATVVTFETATSMTDAGMTADFGRLQCSTYSVQNSGYCRGLASGDWTGYFSSAASVRATDFSRFTFNGSYLTAAWNDNMSIEVLGYRNNAVVYSQTKTISDDAATYFTFDYVNVDRVTFRSFGGVDAGTPGGGTWVAMDNLTLNQAVAGVPEPGSLALLALGLAGFTFARRARRSR